MPPELTDAQICLATGWTLDQVRAQPGWLIRDILICKEAEAVAWELNKPKPRN